MASASSASTPWSTLPAVNLSGRSKNSWPPNEPGLTTALPCVVSTLTKNYLADHGAGNSRGPAALILTPAQFASASGVGKKTVSLLRSLLNPLGSAAIPGRSSSSLPPSFAPGRFAAFLSSSPSGLLSGCRHEPRALACGHHRLRHLRPGRGAHAARPGRAHPV